MAEAIVGDLVKVLVQNLITLISNEVKLVRGFEADFEKLKSSLVDIQLLLSDAGEKEINDRQVKKWLKDLEDVVFEADDICDEFTYQLLHQQVKKSQISKSRKVSCSFSTTTSVFFRRELASKIKNINLKLKAIYDDKVRRGLNLQAAVAEAPHATSVVVEETASYKVEPTFVGRDNEVKEIVDKLITADETFSVIPIIGMGGLGKTTLARKIFNHKTIDDHFQAKSWVCVSLNFDEVTLFKRILETLTKSNVNELLTKEGVLRDIEKCLEGKRYFLVLDDVWDEDAEKWKSILSSLSAVSSGKGNAILVTTRIGNAALIVEPHFSLQLNALSEDECWTIIQATASIGASTPPETIAIGKRIAEKCGGLPLAASVIGSLLRGLSKDEWSSILTNDLAGLRHDENRVIRILKLSYNRLRSSSIKRCFAYCSIFPQDSEISKEHLIELWMAEGLLQANQEEELETVGNNVFNHLLKASLIQESEQDDFGRITHVRMHDLVHDLACLVSGSISSSSVTGSSSSIGVNKVRYLHLNLSEPCLIPENQAASVRTFIYNGKVAENLFIGFKCLHALVITDESLHELPKVIGKLIHLRLFDISGSRRIKYLPNSLGKLYNLQTLIVPRELPKLPNLVTRLLKLRHLHIMNFSLNWESPILPPWIGKLTSLQTLPYFRVGHKEGRKIGQLGKLKMLKGEITIQNLDRVSNKEEARGAGLSRKPNISGLYLGWGTSREDYTNHHENVLEGLEPHSKLESLQVFGYRGRKLPSWTMKMEVYDGSERRLVGLTNLVRIGLVHFPQLEEVPNLGHLPCLQFLELCNLPKVKSLGLSFYGIVKNRASAATAFRALKSLSLVLMDRLTNWLDMEGEIEAFPVLEYLQIRSCPQLKGVPSYFPCLEEMRVEETESPDFTSTNVCRNTSSIQELVINDLAGLISLPDELFQNNQNLSRLDISSCRRLKHVSCLEGGESSLKSLRIMSCDNWIHLPDEFKTFVSLEELHISSCAGFGSIQYVRGVSLGLKYLRILEIHFCPELIELHVSRLQSLEELSIKFCQKLKSISLGISSLRQLDISYCEEFIDFPSESMEACASTLQRLYLYRLDNFANLSMSRPFAFHSLEVLTIEDCPKLESISLRALSLEALAISNCQALHHLPSDLIESCTSSLQILRLSGLENLANLDTLVPHIWSMSHLIRLELYYLPKLMSIPTGSCCFRSLRSLGIGGFAESLSSYAFNDSLNQILEEVQSVEQLDVYGNEDWVTLPDKIQHLTGLRILKLGDFEIETLPEWIGNLSSLEELRISQCERLRHLPSHEAMQRLTKLHKVKISQCPLLVKQTPSIGDDDDDFQRPAIADSEWPKIANIKYLEVDYNIVPTQNFTVPPGERKFAFCFPFPQNRQRESSYSDDD